LAGGVEHGALSCGSRDHDRLDSLIVQNFFQIGSRDPSTRLPIVRQRAH
jgi:hypothetical protein